MSELPHQLNRTVIIKARPETVFRYFTDTTRWAGWWGAGSAIDAVPGGRMNIRYPDGGEALGEVLEVAPPDRIAFTYGYASGKPISPGGSRVTIDLERTDEGTRLTLRHEFADATVRERHVQGWRYQLSLFANIVTNEAFAGVAETVDGWFLAWTIADESARAELLNRIAVEGVHFQDRYGSLCGMADLIGHIGGALRFMPGIRLERRGGVRHCQGSALSDWAAVDGAGKERMAGTSVFALNVDGKIEKVTSFANP